RVPRDLHSFPTRRSSDLRHMLIGDGVPPERIVTVHEGIDVDAVAAAAPVDLHAAFALPHGCPIVGNVAALVPHKGHRYLIEAAQDRKSTRLNSSHDQISY